MDHRFDDLPAKFCGRGTYSKTRDRGRISSQVKYKTGISIMIGALSQSGVRIAVTSPVDYWGKKGLSGKAGDDLHV